MAQTRKSAQLWRRSAIAVAVGLSVMSGASFAQSNTTGDIFGQVTVIEGTTIVVENVATGVKRTITPDASGRFVANSLPPGTYKVTQLRNGAPVGTVDNVEVSVGKNREVAFGASGSTQVVQVVGKIAQIDVSSSDNSSVFTAKQLENLPIASKDLNGVIALAANTVKADSRYDGGVSIGGGGPSENAYYINGFPVTNALTQLGSIELPFGAIQQAQVMTGGYGAEFGRSVGGVVNIITKSGTNEWHGGVNFDYEPDSLRSKSRNIYYPKMGFDTDGSIYYYKEKNKRDKYSYGAYVGGPLVEDKLFFFLAADQTKLKTGMVNSTPDGSGLGTTGWDDSDSTNTRYLSKFDWYLNEDNRLELTLLGDNYKTTDDYYGYDYATHQKTGYSYSQYSKNLGGYTPGVGGDAQILKYSANVTPELMVTALYGQSKTKHNQSFSFSPTAPEIFANSTTNSTDPRYSSLPDVLANPLPAGTTVIPNGAEDSTKSFRFDIEYQLGDHLLRAGIDENRLKSKNAGEKYPGDYWRYYRYDTSKKDYGNIFFYGGQNTTLVEAGATPLNGYYYAVRKRVFDTVTNAESDQSAQYIEDRWQVTKDLLVTMGLRNEGFQNKNGDGETFLKMDSFLAPRLAASWNVNGDSSLKVFGSAGRYSLQIPTHVAVRGASRSTYTDQYFAYTGIDPVTGAPTGLVSLGDPYSGNNEYGQKKNPKSVAGQNLKPTYQDEITLGVESALTAGLTGGASVTYRKLKETIDDFCDYRPIDAYAAANGIEFTGDYYPFGCATINPGKGTTIYLDADGTGKNLVPFKLSAKDIGLPKPKRSYLAVDMFLEHPFSDGWYGKLTYTWSQSKGNTEGQTKSDNAQQDVAVTSTWDFPELMEGSYGFLPNDRTHQIKAYGYYQLTPEWGFGANAMIESGRPKNCFGDYGGSGTDIGGGSYGAVFFYCDGKPSPRGSAGRLPWNYTLDLSASYKPDYVKGLGLRMDVFNVFNRQVAQVINEEHDSVAYYGGNNPTYGRVISYSTPRTIRLSAQYDF
ncbi:TonB-dependent receptor [Ideonella dechloratans]|uniref:TonB-dependent receptor n=1 Tax=Ideonella dechloratans TaxID=36863 RepID=A0A643FEF5_IDEDE|nr:TonB-dependent receptor [Ideonella dechloratans]KAB0584053.1 TonB-dependent receptor [Ideonella dechloratans]UFU08783.1 TonB-dependent receptor [Ideonella dechloratans]